jgi:hypothetical protein
LGEEVEAIVGELHAGVGFVPRGEIDAFLDALAVKCRHNEAVDGDQREVVIDEKFPESGDGAGLFLEFADDALGKTKFDWEHFVGKDALLDAEHVAGKAGLEFGQRVVRKNV